MLSDFSLPPQSALVPEHSVAFMRAMSGGEPFVEDNFLFFSAADWLIAIGYPIPQRDGDAPPPYSPEAFTRALDKAVTRTGARDCWAIAPQLPPFLATHVNEADVFYVLASDAEPPGALAGSLRKAATLLRVEETKVFTPAHRRLWAEFLRRKQLKPQVRELFARTPLVLTAPEVDVRLLNAWDGNDNLAACLVMDYGLAPCSTYLIGAHSREHYTAHAGDLLFAAMLEHARKAGKQFIHLGLGVNDGIRRFKKKWGGKPFLPYQATSWSNAAAKSAKPEPAIRDTLVHTLFSRDDTPHPHFSDNMLFGKRLPPEQRPYAMLWKLEKNGRTSWIGGTAHAFRYSFSTAFRTLFNEVDTVVFEGPLDPQSMAAFARHGWTRDKGTPCIGELLTEEEIRCIEHVVRGPQGRLAKILNMALAEPADVRNILFNARPWCVFFSLWHAYLERQGWRQSVDLEAWTIAHEMGRNVIGMESIEEQLASLESVPVSRIIPFLRDVGNWKNRMNSNVRSYLAGNLTGMLGSSTEFPTRTEQVIGVRDQRFRERMTPYIEAGRCVVFVGTAHMLNLERMLAEDGFTVTKILPTWLHRLRAALGGKSNTARR